jgi:hypothetical protein
VASQCFSIFHSSNCSSQLPDADLHQAKKGLYGTSVAVNFMQKYALSYAY